MTENKIRINRQQIKQTWKKVGQNMPRELSTQTNEIKQIWIQTYVMTDNLQTSGVTK